MVSLDILRSVLASDFCNGFWGDIVREGVVPPAGLLLDLCFLLGASF